MRKMPYLILAIVISSTNVFAQNLLLDPGFEDSDVDNQSNPNWTLEMNFPDGTNPAARFQNAPWASNPNGEPGIGVWLRAFEGRQAGDDPPAEARVYQDVAGAAGITYTASVWSKIEPFYTAEDMGLGIEFLQGETVLETSFLSILEDGEPDSQWYQYMMDATAPLGTDTVRVFGEMIDGEFGPGEPQSAMFDDFELLSVEGNSPALRPGDANMDLKFDQLDLVQVQVAAKYLTGQAATWGEGDWNGAPGGEQGSPPAGNGLFDQVDVIAALGEGIYLTGPYAAVAQGGIQNDGQTSIVYNPTTGELAVDAPAGTDLTSINVDSASGIFTGDAAQNLGGSFDNDADDNIFKATFGSSFGSLSFGNVAQSGLSEDFMLGDLTVIGSLAGGGDLGDVDLVYVPEPASALLLAVGVVIGLVRFRRFGS